ncbi:MAG: hypothetical protein GX574_00120 [Lentisphaerae bacterium]|nr:hypothetical protein [Lentisphaerota bacterium]
MMPTLLRRRMLAVLAFLAGVICSQAAECFFPIHVPELTSSTVLSLELPVEALIDLGGRQEALRILTANDREIPYWIMYVTKTETAWKQDPCQAQATRVKEEEDLSLTLDFELAPKAPAPQGLTINTPLRNFERQVTVLGEDANAWTPLVTDAFIFESSDTLQMRQCDVPFDAGKHRRFRVVIAQASLERQDAYRRVTRFLNREGQADNAVETTGMTRQPFKINSVTFWRKVPIQTDPKAQFLSFSAPSGTISHNAEKRETIYELTPPCFPITGFEIISSERNFLRKVTVQKQYEQDFITAHHGRITACDLPGITQIQPILDGLAPITGGRMRIIIHDGDNPPLAVTDIRLRTPAIKLTFIAEPGQTPCRLSAVAGAKPPVYQHPDIFPAILANQIAVTDVTLGDRQGQPRSPVPTPAQGLPRWIVLLALAAAIVAIAAGVAKAAKSTQGVCSSQE